MKEPGPDRRPLNRLAGERSPYLRLHRHNPVDWYPWGPEALRRAREEDRPIFLSIGYSTCHWCHVMERESFSDPGVATFMNDHFVNVKVDREERPELDEVYMTATQVLTGQGGWPNSLFLTPALEPFFAGTYFPPEAAHGRPSFAQLLEAMAHAWRHRRDDVEEQADSLARAVRHYLEDRGEPAASPPGGDVAERSLAALRQSFDRELGGFGSAPKFPSPGNLLLLLDAAEESEEARAMLARTLDAMARGGIYDQLGGGFHRYATDAGWLIPHFEKMLYDQGLLLEVYGRWAAAARDRQARDICLETAAFLGRELTAPEGALWSALDAETEGAEGAFYAWSRDELHAALGDEDFGFAAPLLGFDGPPFFEGDRYVLHLPARLEQLADRRRLEPQALRSQLESLRRRLFELRARRPRPALDDKVLADWNGAAIRGLAVAGKALEAPELIDQAARAAGFALGNLRPDGGPLQHVWQEEATAVDALLPDYVFLVGGLLALAEGTGDTSWLDAARELRDEQEARLAHPEGGYVTAAPRDDLLATSREVFDGALPSGNGQAALNDLELHRLTGEARWRDAAAGTLRAFASIVERAPEAARTLSLAAKRYAAGH
ncbi:MAG: thioredoxin domain-containing protein [Thermoanaerobaculia bacterium]